MGRHLIDAGNLVGTDGQTKLAEINQIDPIYAYFTINERDLLRIRAERAKAGKTGVPSTRCSSSVLPTRTASRTRASSTSLIDVYCLALTDVPCYLSCHCPAGWT